MGLMSQSTDSHGFVYQVRHMYKVGTMTTIVTDLQRRARMQCRCGADEEGYKHINRTKIRLSLFFPG